MLCCLIGLPLAALYGTAWHELAKTVPEMFWSTVLVHFGERSVLARESSASPSRRMLVSQPEASAKSATGRVSQEPRRTLGSLRDVTVAERREEKSPLVDHHPDHTAQSPRHRMNPEDSELFQSPPLEPAVTKSESRLRGYPSLVSMAWHDRERRTPANAPPLTATVIRPDALGADASADFQYVLDRLRELGAVHYMLETWGNDAQRFRFHCKMALSGNPNYIRHFEAIDRDAMRAMNQVLAEVEQWRKER